MPRAKLIALYKLGEGMTPEQMLAVLAADPEMRAKLAAKLAENKALTDQSVSQSEEVVPCCSSPETLVE